MDTDTDIALQFIIADELEGWLVAQRRCLTLT